LYLHSSSILTFSQDIYYFTSVIFVVGSVKENKKAIKLRLTEILRTE
jgi:hypothetical protein